MKKLFLIFCLAIGMTPVFAGDLFVICFKGEDVGDYIAMSDEFTGEEIVFDFDHGKFNYLLEVRRESLFYDYTYVLEKTNLRTYGLSFEVHRTKMYDDIVEIGEGIACAVMD